MNLKELKKLIYEEKKRMSIISEVTVADRPSAKQRTGEPSASTVVVSPKSQSATKQMINPEVAYVRGAMKMMNELKISFPAAIMKEIPINIGIDQSTIDNLMRQITSSVLENLRNEVRDSEAKDLIDKYLS